MSFILAMEWDGWAIFGAITVVAIVWLIIEARAANTEDDDDESDG